MTVADNWFARRTTSASDWPLGRLLELKRSSVSVVIRAQNEARTVGAVVDEVVQLRVATLVAEVVLMDSLSDDGTGQIARDAGAVVHRVSDVRPDLEVAAGKGEASGSHYS